MFFGDWLMVFILWANALLAQGYTVDPHTGTVLTAPNGSQVVLTPSGGTRYTRDRQDGPTR